MVRVHEMDTPASRPAHSDHLAILVRDKQLYPRCFDVLNVVDVLECLDVFQYGVYQLVDTDGAQLFVADR